MRGTYVEQLERTRRALSRLRDIYSGCRHDRPSEEYRDDVLCFFQNCYHLKDWLKNDPSRLFRADDVEKHVNQNRELQLCADLCNGSKHLVLSKPRSAENPRLGGQSVEIDLGANAIKLRYAVDTDLGPVDVLDLAERCTELWASFIRRSGGAA
jgi:hypothetical protein